MAENENVTSFAAAIALWETQQERVLYLLEPWLKMLRITSRVNTWSAVSNGDSGDPTIMWVTLHTENTVARPRSLEALELLTLLGELSFNCWAQAIGAVWPNEAPAWVEAANRRALRLGVALSGTNGTGDPDTTRTPISQWCERMVVGGGESTCSERYVRIRCHLEMAYQAIDGVVTFGAKLSPRNQLTIPVQVRSSEGEYVDRLCQFVHLLSVQHVCDAGTMRLFQRSDWKPLFQVTKVGAGFATAPMSTLECLYIAQIVGFGADMDDVLLLGVTINDTTTALFTAALQTIMRSAHVEMEPTYKTGTVALMAVPVPDCQRTTAALYSGIMSSHSLRTITINTKLWPHDPDLLPTMSQDCRDHLWRWIAAAIFSRQASHRLRSVHLVASDLRLQDVNVMRDVLCDLDPLSLLFGPRQRVDGDQDKPTAGSSEWITASSFQLTNQPLNVAMGSQTSIELPLQKVRVLDDSALRSQATDLVRVVLPGAGEAWVHVCDIYDRHHVINDNVVEAHSYSAPPVADVTFLDVNQHSYQAVLALIQLIGHDVKRLCLFIQTWGEPLDNWLRAIFAACPQLDDFQLPCGGCIESLDMFSHCFEVGLCKMTRLVIDRIQVVDTHHASRFFHTLADANHPMARRLQSLHVWFSAYDQPLPGVAYAVQEILQQNRVLQELRVSVSFKANVVHHELDAVHSSWYVDDNTTSVSGRGLPLALRSKLAFLSIVHYNQDDDGVVEAAQSHNPTRQLLRTLDSGVLGLILEFAAQSRLTSDRGMSRFQRFFPPLNLPRLIFFLT